MLTNIHAQVGVPSDESQYVHRVGRTARAGKRGQALLMLCDFEAGFLNKVCHAFVCCSCFSCLARFMGYWTCALLRAHSSFKSLCLLKYFQLVGMDAS